MIRITFTDTLPSEDVLKSLNYQPANGFKNFRPDVG